MLESLNYSFRNAKKHNLSNLPHQTIEKLQKNHGVLRGPQLGKQLCRARLGILSVKYNQQDATLYNILYYCQCSTCFEAVSPPPIRSSRTVHTTSGMCQACLLRGWVRTPLAAAASKPGIYQMLCVQFLSFWWWAEKPPKACRALTIIKNIV